MSKVDDIKQKLDAMTAFIEEALEKLQKGEVLNLAHLDQEVSVLCEETLSLPPQEAQKIQPVMAHMISRLEELGVALKDFQNNLKEKHNV